MTEQSEVRCHRCHWEGKIADLKYQYVVNWYNREDVNKEDCCPVCESFHLEYKEEKEDGGHK